MKQGKFGAQVRIFLLLLGITLATRFPYFFDADINWDESTFLLLGKSVTAGHLPYTFLLDNKPPLLWYCFAIIVYLGGKSLFIVRAIGAACVATVAFLSYFNARQLWGPTSGLFAGVLLVSLINLNEEGQAVLSEHLALLPLSGAFTLLLFCHKRRRGLFAVGFLLTAAAMIRFNLAYTVVFVGIYIFLSVLFCKEFLLREKLSRIAAFSAGCFTVVFAIFLPYALENNLDVLYRGTVVAPLSFASEQSGLLGVLQAQIEYEVAVLRFGISVPLTLVSIITFFALGRLSIWLPRNFKNLAATQKRLYILVALFWVSIEFSILRSGVFHDHYNIQLLFCISLLAATLFQEAIAGKYFVWVKRFLGLTAIATITFHLWQYAFVAGHYWRYGTPFHGASFEVARAIARENPDKQPVWLQTNHLAYWLMDIDPIVPAVTHPSSIQKPFLLKAWYGEAASSFKELQKILARAPILIVSRGGIEDYFPDAPEAQARLERDITAHYAPIESDNPKLRIYKRLVAGTEGRS